MTRQQINVNMSAVCYNRKADFNRTPFGMFVFTLSSTESDSSIDRYQYEIRI